MGWVGLLWSQGLVASSLKQLFAQSEAIFTAAKTESISLIFMENVQTKWEKYDSGREIYKMINEKFIYIENVCIFQICFPCYPVKAWSRDHFVTNFIKIA